jgi:hypothetical protein
VLRNIQDKAMKNLILLMVLFICTCQVDTLRAQTLMIDNFEKEPTNVGKKYPKYVGTQEGYDIYYEKADVRLSRVQVNPKDTNDKALRADFNLPPAFSWGNWLSVRREFQSPMNLQSYKGLELKVKVDVPSPEAFLRIALSDLTDDNKGGDEMWWFDCDKNLLKTKTAKWNQIRLPFNRFFP